MKKTTKRLAIVSLLMLVCLTLCFAFACGSSPAVTYKVTFMNEGAQYGEVQTIVSGKTATRPETDPEKAATKEYSYSFIGWYNGETKWNFVTDEVTSDVTLTAKYSEKLNKYTATIKYSYDESLEAVVPFTNDNKAEQLVKIKNNLPENSAAYTYSWATELPTVLPLENVTYTIDREAVSYIVKITHDYDEHEEGTNFNVENRATKLETIKSFLPATTVDYVYSWKTPLPTTLPLEDVTYVVTREVRKYDVTFMNGTEKFDTQKVAYNTVATEPTDVPEKAADQQYIYTFDFWSLDGETEFNFETPITADTTLVAVYAKTLQSYDVTVNTVYEGTEGTAIVYEDVDYGTKLDLTKLDNDLYDYVLYNGETAITEYTVTGDATLKAVYTFKVFDFEDGENIIMSEIARRSSSAGSGHTLEVVDFTATSDKVTGKALKVVTTNQDLGDISILDAYLDAVFANSKVSSIAFDVYLETQVNAESIDIRMSTSSTDASSNYRYLYPKQGQTGTIFYTRANYNEKSNYVYNGFRQMFFNRYADTFYIDNVRVCYGETAQVNQYYTFEQTSLRHNSTDGAASYIYPGNLPGTWQIAVTGTTNGITFDTTVTNGCATSIKIPNISSDSLGVQFNSTSTTWYDVFKNGLSIDIYSTVDIAYGNLQDGSGNIGSVKANTWTTIYVPASHLASSKSIFKVLNSTGADIYFCNLKTITDAEYQTYLANSLGFENGSLTYASNIGSFYAPGDANANYYSVKVGQGTDTILQSAEITSENVHSGNYALKITKTNGYLPFFMNPNSYFYSQLSGGFTVWVYSTVAITSHEDAKGSSANLVDGMNGKIMYNNETGGYDIPANKWVQLTIGKDELGNGRFMIFSGSTAGDMYFDDFAPLDETTSCVVTFSYQGYTTSPNYYYPRSKVVATGSTVTAPVERIPSGKTTFVGWAYDVDGTSMFDFSTPITSSIKLYAIYA